MINYNYIKSGKYEIYTEYFGNIKNIPILLISGAMAPGRFYNDVFCNILVHEGYFVIRYDHRDIGLSSAIDYIKEPYSLYDLALDAINIIDFYKLSKVHVIGHSMGGGIAQLMAINLRGNRVPGQLLFMGKQLPIIYFMPAGSVLELQFSEMRGIVS